MVVIATTNHNEVYTHIFLSVHTNSMEFLLLGYVVINDEGSNYYFSKFLIL